MPSCHRITTQRESLFYVYRCKLPQNKSVIYIRFKLCVSATSKAEPCWQKHVSQVCVSATLWLSNFQQFLKYFSIQFDKPSWKKNPDHVSLVCVSATISFSRILGNLSIQFGAYILSLLHSFTLVFTGLNWFILVYMWLVYTGYKWFILVNWGWFRLVFTGLYWL